MISWVCELKFWSGLISSWPLSFQRFLLFHSLSLIFHSYCQLLGVSGNIVLILSAAQTFCQFVDISALLPYLCFWWQVLDPVKTQNVMVVSPVSFLPCPSLRKFKGSQKSSSCSLTYLAICRWRHDSLQWISLSAPTGYPVFCRWKPIVPLMDVSVLHHVLRGWLHHTWAKSHNWSLSASLSLILSLYHTALLRNGPQRTGKWAKPWSVTEMLQNYHLSY